MVCESERTARAYGRGEERESKLKSISTFSILNGEHLLTSVWRERERVRGCESKRRRESERGCGNIE